MKRIFAMFEMKKLDGEGNIVHHIEKPTLKYKLSTGIYIFNKRILGYIERGKYLDLPDMIRKLIRESENIRGYMFEGYWMDIGRHEDYSMVLEEFEKVKGELL